MRRREFLLTASAAALPGGRAVSLVERGRSSYSIVLAADAVAGERRAAAELQRFLEEMSGVQLPIVDAGKGDCIVLRHTSEFGPEGFSLKTEGRNVVISGGRPRGVLYGAYELLEKLGCRWFTPEVSRIPRMRTVRIGPLDEVQKPAFEYREPYFTEATGKEWASRNRTNGNLSELDESVGGKLAYFPFVHTADALVPPSKYFGEHPEYYSLINGRRTADDAQLCLSNAEVLRIATSTVLGWVDAHPEATIFSVSQNDNQRYCECDACRRIEQEEGGAHSGPLLRFVNAIAEEVEKKDAGKLIDTLAYQYTEDPPEKVRPRKNVRIRLCPIGACQAHPYEKCPQNASVMKNLHSWSKITNQLYVWHYVTNFANYVLPFPDFDELAADVPMYQKHGVVGIFLEGAYPKGGGGENAELRSWVLARQSWNTETDVNAAVNEFLAGVYGERAARPLREWFDLLHAQVRPAERHIWTYSSPALSEAALAKGRALFERAEREAADEAARKRVRKARLPLDYAGLLEAERFAVRGSTYAPADLGAVKDRFPTFLAAARAQGVTSIHEGRELEQDEREFAEKIKAYEAVVLEAGGVRAAIVPELSGRVVSLVDVKTGREAVRRPRPDEHGYPDRGGACLVMYRDREGRKPYPFTWKVAQKDGASVVLAGASSEGLSATRRLWIEGGRLRSLTRIECAGPEAREVTVLARTEFGAAEAALRFEEAAGGAYAKALLPAGETGAGHESFEAARIGRGEWRVESRAGGVALAQGFAAEAAERCTASWLGRGEDYAVLGVWSKPVRLEAGSSVQVEGWWGVG